MSMLKKMLALLAVVALLAAVPVTTAAEEDPFANLFVDEILHSYTIAETEADTTGFGLAFKITLNIDGAVKNPDHRYEEGSAEFGDYTVVRMGAVLANKYRADLLDVLNQENADGNNIVKVDANFLCEVSENTCSFAVRIIRIPEAQKGTAIFCRPYCVLRDTAGNEKTVYAGENLKDINVYSFNKIYFEENVAETPTLKAALPGLGDKLEIVTDSVSASYEAIDPNYRESFKVNFTLKNKTNHGITSDGDNIACTFKDADGNALGTGVVPVDVLNPGETKDVEIYVPFGTTTIEASANLNVVPQIAQITLPTIGSDIDVTKKKNRIRVSAAEAFYNEDGTIHVALTFQNYTSNWITEETDYVQYTYYNAAGTKIKTETLYIGVIDTKKHPQKTFEFDLPATAASVKITKSKIVYWTEWS